MRVFIVHAHHEPTSFNAAMTAEAARALIAAGHEVQVSDLYAMGFDPVSDRRNFTTTADPARLDQQVEERHAAQNGGFAADLQAEMDKLAWCDVLILQFPLWWLGPPAILKGWIDRVLALGFAYGGGRWFDGGVFSGKRAMCSVTIGGPEAAYSGVGVYERSMEETLHPLLHGTFAFVGFEVVEPFLVHAPQRMSPAEREAVLADYRGRVLALDAAPARPRLRSAHYERMVRKAD
jgi:NAD(P)H dehydrogenase (quinone)